MKPTVAYSLTNQRIRFAWNPNNYHLTVVRSFNNVHKRELYTISSEYKRNCPKFFCPLSSLTKTLVISMLSEDNHHEARLIRDIFRGPPACC